MCRLWEMVFWTVKGLGTMYEGWEMVFWTVKGLGTMYEGWEMVFWTVNGLGTRLGDGILDCEWPGDYL